DALDPHVPAFKVASYELSHLPLVRRVLERGKPAFVSTGASTLTDVLRVVALAREVGNEQIVFLQCTAAYPAPPADVNARAIVTLREASGCLVGLSDHSRDPVIAPVVAVALGAVVIEKHFTLSNRLPGPDQKFAVEPDELGRLVRAVREAQAVLGTGAKELLAVERELHGFARRSIFSVREIGAGEVFVEAKRPSVRCASTSPTASLRSASRSRRSGAVAATVRRCSSRRSGACTRSEATTCGQEPRCSRATKPR